jgi:uncharacterized protein
VDFPIIYYEGAALTERDGYGHGVPCWVDTWQEDPDTGATFYAGVFGWEVEKGTPPGTDARYYMCRLRGSDVAAIGSPPPAGMPPAWTTHVWVDDADAVAASVVNAGGSLLREPFGSFDGGRVAIVADPSGAVFGLWTPDAHRGAQRVNEPSAFSMGFLRTPDPEGAKAFYGAVLGLTTEAFGPMLLWRLPGYVGGVPEQPVSREVVAVMVCAGEGEAAHWRADFWIADADAAAARATQLGGTVLAGPEDAGPFREAVLGDPAGATISVSQLTAGPQALRRACGMRLRPKRKIKRSAASPKRTWIVRDLLQGLEHRLQQDCPQRFQPSYGPARSVAVGPGRRNDSHQTGQARFDSDETEANKDDGTF